MDVNEMNGKVTHAAGESQDIRRTIPLEARHCMKSCTPLHRRCTMFVVADTSRCVACWKCVDVCPRQVIGKIDLPWHKHIVFRQAGECIGCERCVKTCPEQVFSVIE